MKRLHLQKKVRQIQRTTSALIKKRTRPTSDRVRFCEQPRLWIRCRHFNGNAKQGTKGVTRSIVHLPILSVCAWLARRTRRKRYLPPLALWNRKVATNSDRILCKAIATHRSDSVTKQPVTSSRISNLPSLGEPLSRPNFCSRRNSHVADQTEIITAVRKCGRVYGWRVLSPRRCNRGVYDSSDKNRSRCERRWQRKRSRCWYGSGRINRRGSRRGYHGGLRLKELCSKCSHTLGQDRVDIRSWRLWWLSCAGAH